MIFVVDACIASSMGHEDSDDPISQNCRTILMEISNQSHTIAINDKKNASKYFKEWFLIMLWKRRYEDVNGHEILKLRSQIIASIYEYYNTLEDQQATIAIVCKDVHLLEAALATDKFVISNDNKCRNQLSCLMGINTEKLGLANLIWVNSDDNLVTWFRNGAKVKEISEKWKLN